MARGRHRNSALHRVHIPLWSATAAAACAAAAWTTGEPLVLRLLAAGAALAAVTVSVVLRRWDLRAGLDVARERAAKAGLSWRLEERQAELEEARQRVGELETKVRSKRAELARLRTEHAALLRRYATAESERAKALEGRRQLALEAAQPAKALPAQATDHRTAGGAPTPLTYLQAYEALSRLSRSAARQREREQARPVVAPKPRSSDGFDFFRAAR